MLVPVVMGSSSPLRAPSGNRLLMSLPAEEREVLFASLRSTVLPAKAVLFEPGDTIESVYFPLDGVIALVSPLADGNVVEVATIGNEGIFGVPLSAGGSLAVRAISQVGGRSLQMERRRSSARSWA